MPKVSIILPSRVAADSKEAREGLLQKTISDCLAKARGDIEIYAVVDGPWPSPHLKDDKRVHVIKHGEPKGMRPSINGAVRLAKGEFIMKMDAHCMVDEGFDVKLAQDCADDWLVVPRRYSLDAEHWTFKKNGKPPVDAHFLSYPYELDRPGVGLHGTVWLDRARERKHILVDDEMSSQGSCWFMSKKHWDKLGEMNIERYGNFIAELQEMGCRTWLSGGRLVVNKNTWYSHLHKGVEYGRGYFISKAEMSRGGTACVDWWMNDRWPLVADGGLRTRPFRWLVEHFWPVPGWPTSSTGALDWDVVERGTADFNAKYQAGLPVGF